jgi:hypothetical protein
MNREIEKIKSLVSDEVWDTLANTNAMIVGGALTSVYTNAPVNDIDVYFKTPNDFASFVSNIFHVDLDNPLLLSCDTSPFALIAVNMTNKSILFLDRVTKQKVQVIAYKLFPDINAIFDEFDFTINMAGIYCSTEELVLHDKFLIHNAQRYIGINANTAYPITSVLRVQKYRDRGYKVSKSELLKLLYKITTLDIDSWDKAKDHCGGMYGLSVSDIFPEDKEFSIDLVIDALDNVADNLSELDTQYHAISMSEGIIRKSFPHIYSRVEDSREELSKLRIFKNVKLGDDCVLCSHYKPSFKYEMNKVVNGGVHGIWAYYGNDVIRGQYSSDYKSWVVELQPEETANINIDGSTQIIIKGDVKVINCWTAFDFRTKFK